MSEYSIGPVEISVNGGRSLPNRLFRNVNSSRGLAVLFPDLNYNCDMPLFFFSTQLLLQRGLDVLQVQADYTDPHFAGLSPDRQIDWLRDDAWAAIRAGSRQSHPSRLVLVGKSIGTLAMSVLVLNHPELMGAVSIWLTPLYRLPHLEQAAQQLTAPALFISGTGDLAHDANRLEQICQMTGSEKLVLDDADHGMQVPGDLDRSLDYLRQVIHGMAQFLTRSGFE